MHMRNWMEFVLGMPSGIQRNALWAEDSYHSQSTFCVVIHPKLTNGLKFSSSAAWIIKFGKTTYFNGCSCVQLVLERKILHRRLSSQIYGSISLRWFYHIKVRIWWELQGYQNLCYFMKSPNHLSNIYFLVLLSVQLILFVNVDQAVLNSCFWRVC